MMRLLSLLSITLSITAHNSWGQQSVPQSTLKDAEFIIEKERKLLLPEASRFFESAPASSRIAEPVKSLQYALPTIAPAFDLLPRKILVLRAQQEVITRLYGNYVQGGYGNFYTPYLEGFFDNKRNPKYAYGLQLRHLSSGKEKHAEESHNTIQLHGKMFTKALLLGATMHYHRDRYQLYHAGLSTIAAQQQVLHQFGLKNTLANYISGKWNYQLEAAFHHLLVKDKAQERQFGLHGKSDYALNDAFTLKVITDLHLTKHQDTAVYRNLYRFKPTLDRVLNDFEVQGGVNLVYQNDVSDVVNALNVYPVLEVKYNLRKWLRPYIGASGDMQQTSLQGFIQENPLLASHIMLRHTNQRFEFCGGAKGDVIEQIAYHLGLTVGKYQHLPCLTNNPGHPGLFDVQYDEEATVLNTFVELTHTNLAETHTTRLRGDYFHYTLQELSKPWNRPRYQLDLLSTYCLYDKLHLKGTMYWLGGLEALDVATGSSRKLEDVFDLGLGIEYLWSARLSTFFNCQNILARDNQRYLHYPTRGFHCMLGLTYGW